MDSGMSKISVKKTYLPGSPVTVQTDFSGSATIKIHTRLLWFQTYKPTHAYYRQHTTYWGIQLPIMIDPRALVTKFKCSDGVMN